MQAMISRLAATAARARAKSPRLLADSEPATQRSMSAIWLGARAMPVTTDFTGEEHRLPEEPLVEVDVLEPCRLDQGVGVAEQVATFEQSRPGFPDLSIDGAPKPPTTQHCACHRFERLERITTRFIRE